MKEAASEALKSNNPSYPQTIQAFWALQRKAKRNPAYQAILAKAEEIGWPQAFRCDLALWDRSYILDNEGMHFIWAIRPLGTHIYRLDPNPVVLDWFDAACLADREARYFHWDGEKLDEVSQQEARTLLQGEIL